MGRFAGSYNGLVDDVATAPAMRPISVPQRLKSLALKPISSLLISLFWVTGPLYDA
jgi:hypothetical protein